MSPDENAGVLGTMTAHLYMRVGNTNLTEIGTAEVEVGPNITLDEALAECFENAAKTLREGRERG